MTAVIKYGVLKKFKRWARLASGFRLMPVVFSLLHDGTFGFTMNARMGIVSHAKPYQSL